MICMFIASIRDTHFRIILDIIGTVKLAGQMMYTNAA